jgi:hypothetical protein
MQGPEAIKADTILANAESDDALGDEISKVDALIG